MNGEMSERDLRERLALIEKMIAEGLVVVSEVHILRFLPDPKTPAH